MKRCVFLFLLLLANLLKGAAVWPANPAAGGGIVGGDSILEAQPQDSSQLQRFTPSSLLRWRQWEAKVFQQLYTQRQFFAPEGQAIDLSGRSTYYSAIMSLYFGTNARINVGMEGWLRSVLVDTAFGSPFRLFTFPGGSSGRTALTSLGPKVKFQPFRRLNGFTVQTSLLFPVARDPEGRSNGRPYLASANYLLWNQAFYTRALGSKGQLFTELDLYLNIDRGLQFRRSGSLETPASVFVSWFPTRRFTLYGMTQFWPQIGEGIFIAWWWQAGAGAKWRFSESLDLEFMYGRFLAGRNAAGPANALNLGLRFVHW